MSFASFKDSQRYSVTYMYSIIIIDIYVNFCKKNITSK